MKMHARGRRRAFTVVELIIATAVIVVGASAIYDQFVRTALPSHRRLLEAQGRMYAHQKLAELSGATPESFRNWRPNEDFDFVRDDERFRWRAELTPQADGTVQISVTTRWDSINAPEGDPVPEGLSVVIKGLRSL